MKIEVEVIKLQVLFLLHLDILPKGRMFLEHVTGHMRARNRRWELPVRYTRYNAFMRPLKPRRIYCNKHQLELLHITFYHPDSANLYNLLKRVFRMTHPENSRDTKTYLKWMSKMPVSTLTAALL